MGGTRWVGEGGDARYNTYKARTNGAEYGPREEKALAARQHAAPAEPILKQAATGCPQAPAATGCLQLPAGTGVTAGGSPTERRTASLSGNRRTNGLLLGHLFRKKTPNRTPFRSTPLLVCLVGRLLYCQELARVTTLYMMDNKLLPD